jgi:hypothetical protein
MEKENGSSYKKHCDTAPLKSRGVETLGEEWGNV